MGAFHSVKISDQAFLSQCQRSSLSKDRLPLARSATRFGKCTFPSDHPMPKPSLMQRLRNNDPTLQRLCLDRPIEHYSKHYHEDSFERLLIALQVNDTVTNVYLGPNFYSELDDQQRSELVRTIGRHCHRLQVWTISTLDHTTVTFSGEALGQAVGMARNLQTLRVERTLDVVDVGPMAAGFWNHPSLERVTFSQLQPLVSNVSNTRRHPLAPAPRPPLSPEAPLDPLLTSLSTCQQLKAVSLSVTEAALLQHSRLVTPTAVARLATIPTLLKWLVLHRLHLCDAHVVSLVQAMKQSSTVIKGVDVCLNPSMTRTAWQAILELLETNTSLETINLPMPPLDCVSSKDLVHFYLSLNQQGRRSFITTLPKTEWVDRLAAVSKTDLSAVFVLVRENPWQLERNRIQG